LVIAVNGAITDLFLLKKRLQKMPLFPLSYTVVGFISLVIILIATIGYGHWRIGQNRSGSLITMSIVQGNIEQDKKWEPAFQNEVMDIYFNLSRNVTNLSPDIIVWPETSVPFYFRNDVENTRKMTFFQKGLSSHLLFGSVLIKSQEDDRTLLTNSAVLLDKQGKSIYRYDKIHLVPFGEYVPLRKFLFFMDKLVSGIGDYVSGDEYTVAETDYGRFATLICYEIVFPGLVRKFYSNGGDFIITITNDAWFGNTAGPYQHFTMAVFRAIENRKPVIRSANTGISGFIDSNGQVISSTSLFKRVSLTEKIKSDGTLTFYTKYGDLFSYLCFVITIILFLNIKLWR
jgi:apolipoprotein N-acyltransferase